MKNKTFLSHVLLFLLISIVAMSAFGCSGCKKKKNKDSIVIMSEDVSGLFNPFYATSGADQDVVGMTQIGMLTTDGDGKTACGANLPTVVLDYKYETDSQGNGVYTFVIKNNLKFSDGVNLTMNDVLFNMYEYLDPAYTGSSTMYSIKIKGLNQYRLQQNLSSGSGDFEDDLYEEAYSRAFSRRQELIDVFRDYGRISEGSYSISGDQLKAKIRTEYEPTDGYKEAVYSESDRASKTDAEVREKLCSDYDNVLKEFKNEIESDYLASKEAFDFTTAPYNEWKQYQDNERFKFLLLEGKITPEYQDVEGKKNKTKIIKFNGLGLLDSDSYKTIENCKDTFVKDKMENELDRVLTQWGTGSKIMTTYTAIAKSILLNTYVDGSLTFPNISGIVSLGHTTETESVLINGTNYLVAHEHNNDGSVTDTSKYDVLQITLDGVDPKAIYNFGFTVAPAHYYTADADHPNGRTIDIKNNMFGVEWNEPEKFQSAVIQSQKHVEIPVGAGAYKATDANNSDNPSGSNFVKSNVVYFKANDYFMFPVKTEKLRFQVVSSTNAIDKLINGEVDYITPEFTKANSEKLASIASKGFKQLDSWQLGYGYIGVNAGKVPNVNIRRAIMSAMQTELALQYYKENTCKTISWPMSTVSWAYPYEDDEKTSKPNGHSYTEWEGVEKAKEKIRNYMALANVSEGDSALKITFTIAGSSITEHPTYGVFKQASEILNSLGWNTEVKADSQALTKLSTGSLAVWAAAWGSTVDPDMYQVYHKNSSATSVKAWGYDAIKESKSSYPYETSIINTLSVKIDEARSITDETTRKELYEEAMGYVLDLAIEMPVYQRKTLYAYNSKTISGLADSVNPYKSPLEKIWEVELITK